MSEGKMTAEHQPFEGEFVVAPQITARDMLLWEARDLANRAVEFGRGRWREVALAMAGLSGIAAQCSIVPESPAALPPEEKPTAGATWTPPQEAGAQISSEAVQRTPAEGNGQVFGQGGREPEASPPVQELPPGTLSAEVAAAETEQQEPQEPPARHTPTPDDLKPPRPSPKPPTPTPPLATSTPRPTTPPTVAATQEQPTQEAAPAPTQAAPSPEPTTAPTVAPTQEALAPGEFRVGNIVFGSWFSPEDRAYIQDGFAWLQATGARVNLRGQDERVYDVIQRMPINFVGYDPDLPVPGMEIRNRIVQIGPSGLRPAGYNFEAQRAFMFANLGHEGLHTLQTSEGNFDCMQRELEAEVLETEILRALLPFVGSEAQGQLNFLIGVQEQGISDRNFLSCR